MVNTNITGEADALDHIRSLEKRVRVLEQTARVVSLVNTTGQFIFYAADGVTPIFRVGDQPNGDRGITIYRETGQEAFITAKAFSTDTTQTLQLKDKTGNVIFQDDFLGNVGINFPKLPLHFYPINTVLDVSTASATFVDLFASFVRRQNPGFRVWVTIFTSGAGVSAEVTLYDTFFASNFGTLVTHTGTTAFDYELVSGVLAFAGWQSEHQYNIRARISAGGPGTVTVRMKSAIGD